MPSVVPPARPPGPPSAYSNQNYAITAAMLERATGVAWEELARTQTESDDCRPLANDRGGSEQMGSPY